MNYFSRNLAVRALNYWRNYNLSSYLGLRLFIQQMPKSENSNFLATYLLGKIPLRRFGRYRPFLRFKSISADGMSENRIMYAASPSTALAEAYALSLLASTKTFENKEYIFSYKWPESEKAGRSFTYFYSGYSDRNNKISNLLRKQQNLFVVVHDIKSFYPSINSHDVLKELDNHLKLEKGLRLDYKEFIYTISNHMVQSSSIGIPIAPPLSHILANLALEKIDHEMHKLLKERYFRYVDDIIMVLNKDEIQIVNRKLSDLLKSKNFDLNEDKYDKISSLEWFDNIINGEEQFVGQQFDQLINRIELFLWNKPSEKDKLAKAFKMNNLAMPISRFAINAMYGRYHKFMKWLVNTTTIYRRLLAGLKYESDKTLISDSSYLFKQFSDIAAKISVGNDEKHTLIKKMRTQRLRYLLNRLVYLTPFENFNKLFNLTPDTIEFYEFKTIINSLIKKSIVDLNKIPGPAITTYASIFKELNLDRINIDESELKYATLDTIATLLVFGIIEIPDKWVDSLPLNDREYINFCSFKPITSRVLKDYSFEDEIRTLQINEKQSLCDLFMTSRFSDVEQINLDALLPVYGY
jgi:hypothetical protein